MIELPQKTCISCHVIARMIVYALCYGIDYIALMYLKHTYQLAVLRFNATSNKLWKCPLR